MNYANLSLDELRHQVREMQIEGIDGVYLDREEWRQLKTNLVNQLEGSIVSHVDSTLKPKKYIQYYGMRFYIIEEGGFDEGNTFLSRAFYKSFRDVYEVNQKGENIDYEI